MKLKKRHSLKAAGVWPLSLLLLSVFTASCFGPPPEIPAEIPVKYQKVYVEPFLNMSTIELADGFPRDSVRVLVLFQEIEKAHRAMVSEIRLQGKRGLYRMVEKDDFPTITIKPVLMPYKVEERILILPVFLKITDHETGQEYKKQYNVEALFPTKELSKEDYHFWGVMLAQWRRNFPAKEIGQLFYGKVEKKGK